MLRHQSSQVLWSIPRQTTERHQEARFPFSAASPALRLALTGRGVKAAPWLDEAMGRHHRNKLAESGRHARRRGSNLGAREAFTESKAPSHVLCQVWRRGGCHFHPVYPRRSGSPDSARWESPGASPPTYRRCRFSPPGPFPCNRGNIDFPLPVSRGETALGQASAGWPSIRKVHS